MLFLKIILISISFINISASATEFPLGSPSHKSFITSQASEQINQGEQLLGAMSLYLFENDKWPSSLQELLDKGYLNSIPQISFNENKTPDSSVVNSQNLAPSQWEMPLPGVAVARIFLPTGTHTPAICKEINKSSQKYEGILKSMLINAGVQCFGSDLRHLQVVVSHSFEDRVQFAQRYNKAVYPRSIPPVSDPTDKAWLVPPPEKKSGN